MAKDASVCPLQKTATWQLLSEVSMCDRAPVAALYERFGGEFSDGKQKTPHGRLIFSWMVYNADAVEALEVFSQECLVKRVVAQAGITVRKKHVRKQNAGF
jgi:hypothetical protein